MWGVLVSHIHVDTLKLYCIVILKQNPLPPNLSHAAPGWQKYLIRAAEFIMYAMMEHTLENH